MKCVILSRVSTGHQDLEQQTVKVKQEAIKDGYTEDNIIIIEDIESAVKLSEEERNGLNKLKDYIESDASINCVYTYEISRISRQAGIVYSIRNFLIEHNVQLVVLNPYFKMLKDDGSLSETSNIFFGIFSAMSENEGLLRKARIKKAVDKYRSEGRHTGGNIMFGYTTDGSHKYIPHPENAHIVREIFNMYTVDKMSIRAIAKELHERGVKLWTCKTERKATSYLTMCNNVNSILHRTEYIGENNRPQIISRKQFEEAQIIMKHKTVCAVRKGADALLRGMIYNKETGLLLSANTATKFYYSKRMKGPAISYECADKIIWNWIKEKSNEYKDMNDEKLMSQLNKEYSIIEKKMQNNFNKRLDLNAALDRLEERIVLGKISTYKANELGEKIENEINDLDRLYNQLQEQRIELRYKIRIIEESDFDLSNMTLNEKIKLIKQMIDKIYIERIDRTKCKLEIISKIPSLHDILLVDTYHKRLYIT